MSKKRIQRNIEEFVIKIIKIIMDQTKSGHQTLMEVLTAARVRYSFDYRSGDFDHIIKDITDFPESVPRSQTIANFFNKPSSSWLLYSANANLLLELINVTGYVRDDDETDDYLQKHVLQELKDVICEEIRLHAAKEDNLLRLAEEAARQAEAMRRVKAVDLTHVILCGSHEEAKKHLFNKKTVFCLDNSVLTENNTPDWQLTWYDLRGLANYVPIDDADNNDHSSLMSLLKQLKNHQLPLPCLDRYDQLKVVCDELLLKYPVGVYLFDDAKEASAFARSNPGQHAFYLQAPVVNEEAAYADSRSDKISEALKEKWQLSWYDLLGSPTVLTINNALQEELSRLPLSQLPSPTSPVYYTLKAQCEFILSELFDKIQLKLNMEEVGPTPLTSTFVLTHQLPHLELCWYDSLHQPHTLSLEHYPLFKNWLMGQEKITETVLPQLKTYLMHVNIRTHVDDRKKQEVLSWFQRKHGISLIVTNDIATIPPYRLISGTYLLVREGTGEWLLYQRQKGVNTKIATNDWTKFKAILANEKNKHCMPEQLTDVTKSKLRECILNSIKTLQKKQMDCVGVNDFSPNNSEQYKASSFVVTRKEDAWTIYYIDLFLRPFEVDFQANPEAQQLVSQWKCEPEKLGGEQLTALNKSLAQFVVRCGLDDSKKRDVSSWLQKKHGISLIVTNDMATLPKYRLINETYLLVREPLATTGEWVLYQRQKGVNTKILTDDWEFFHVILANEETKHFSQMEIAPEQLKLEELEIVRLKPEQLTVETQNALRECIQNSLKSIKYMTMSCVGVNDFLPCNSNQYKAASFVVTNENNTWKFYYIDLFQRALEMGLHESSHAQVLLKTWYAETVESTEPASLTPAQLDELAKTLAHNKPQPKLNADDFAEVRQLLEKKYSANSEAVISNTDRLSDNIVTAASPQPGKLKVAQLAAIGGLFKSVAPTLETSCPSQAPSI